MMTSKTPKTMFEKIWDEHVVLQEEDAPAVLYIDLHLVHEVTSPQAFTGLRGRGIAVRRPERTLATMDHSSPTTHKKTLHPNTTRPAQKCCAEPCNFQAQTNRINLYHHQNKCTSKQPFPQKSFCQTQLKCTDTYATLNS